MDATIIVPILFVVAGLAAIWYFVYHKKQNASANVPGFSQMPPISDSWSFVYSNGVSGDASSFTFPKVDGVHYVTKRAVGIAMGKTITMRFNIGGVGAFKVADPSDILPATLRLLLWGQTINDRWWSRPINLDDGDLILTVRIDPSVWTGVGGNPPVQQAPFETVVANRPNLMGFTFGGQYFAGHGVFCPEGTKTFKLLEYSII